MRAAFVAVAAAFVAVASAQGIPSCATNCLTTADLGSCSFGDNACLCKSEAFVNSTRACFEKDCTGDDLTTAIAVAAELCRASGVTLTNTAPAGSATSGTASATGSASASASRSATATTAATTASSPSASSTAATNSAITFSGASPMVGALAAMAGVVFAL